MSLTQENQIAAISQPATKVGAGTVWLVFLVIAAIIQIPGPLNHDAAWHFQTAFRFLEGARLGYDVFDVNPPMSMWFYTLPAMVVNVSGLDPAIVFEAFYLLVATSIVWISTRALALLEWPKRDQALFVGCIGAVVLLLPGVDFAQRELFTTVLVLPYLMLVAVRTSRASPGLLISAVCGLVAAIGIGVKPYFVVLPVLVELWLMLHTRRITGLFRVETISILLALIGYLVMVQLATPGYFERVLPEALATYSGYNIPISHFVGQSLLIIAPAIIAFSLLALIAGKRIWNHFVQLFVVSALAFWIAALLQQKAWNYHLLPVSIFLLLAAFVLWMEIRNTGEVAGRTALLGIAVLAMTIVVPVTRYLNDSYGPYGTGARVNALTNVMERHVGNSRHVFAFITSPRDIHPAIIESGTRWAGNAGAQVFLPAVLSNEENSDRRTMEIARKHDLETIALIMQKRPELLFLDVGNNRLAINDPQFSYLDYYASYPDFETLMKEYRETDQVGNFRVFVRQNSN